MKFSLKNVVVLATAFISSSYEQDNLYLRASGNINEEERERPTPYELEFKSEPFHYFYKTNKNVNRELPPLEWSNLVFVVLLHNEYKLDNMLINEHFHTWMLTTGEGLDMIFVADADDTRTDESLLPGTKQIKPTVHVKRSTAIKDGKKVRAKAVDALKYAEEMFGNDERKHFFIKMDPDTFFLPDRFMAFMNELYTLTFPKPVDFGRPACFMSDVCHSQGGMYGLSRSGLKSMVGYIVGHPEIMEAYKPHRKTQENLMDHEDFAVSYWFKVATGYPMVSVGTIGENLNKMQEPYKEDLISIHQVKFTHQYKKLKKYYQNEMP